MAKAFGAIVRFLFVLFIIGLLGYNTYEIARLRTEVDRLRGEKSATAQHRVGSGTMEQIAEAQSHAERASALLKEKKFSAAADEMKAASGAAARATGNAQAESRSKVAEVQQSLEKLSGQTAALWKQAEGLAKKVQPATNGDEVVKTDNHGEQATKEPPRVSENDEHKTSKHE